MKTIAFWCATAACAVASPCQDNRGVDLSTPRTTVASFVAALSRNDIAAMRRCVDPSAPSKKADRFFASGGLGMRLTDVRVEEQEATAQAATVRVSFKAENRPDPVADSVVLSRRPDGWRIVSGAMRPTSQIIGVLVEIVAGNDTILSAFSQARDKAHSISCLANMKNLALAHLMYAQDYDEVWARRDWVKAVEPYHKNPRLLSCPSHGAGKVSYSMNSALFGASMTALLAPAETVVLYEGENQKLVFRHQGKAAVGFADGRCRLVDANEARSLKWSLAPPAPTKPAPRSSPKTRR